MSETRFTPGPWVASTIAKADSLQGVPGFWHEVLDARCGYVLGEVYEFDGDDEFPDGSSARANAHLIAAVPELYEASVVARAALVAAAETLWGVPAEDRDQALLDQVEAAIAAIAAALAKARGDQ